MSERRLTGRIPRSGIGMLELPRVSAAIVDGFRALGADASSTVADAMDEIGLAKSVGASTLRPIYAGALIVGRALTMRNVVQQTSPFKGASAKVSLLAEIEAHNLAEPGDVLVIEGVRGVSNIGGISAAIGKRQGEIGAIVDGGVRDVGECRRIDYPIWSRDVTPLTGKWRVQTISINQTVEIAGVQVTPGDIVVADETGVCFVPKEAAEQVLKRSCEILAAEAGRQADIASGMPVPDLANRAGSFTMPKRED